MGLWRKYQDVSGVSCQSRNSYLYGLYEGLSGVLRQAKTKTEEEKFQTIAAQEPTKVEEIKNKYAVMVISKQKKLQEAIKTFCPNLRNQYNRTPLRDASSLEHGVRDGKTIEIRQAIQGNTQKTLNS